MPSPKVKQTLMAAAGAAGGGGGENVESLFATYTYDGNSGNQTITTGLDMTGQGGMTWFKTRSHAFSHLIFDTVRGETKRLMPATTSNEDVQASGRHPTFTSTGFTLANDTSGDLNYSGREMGSWSFRQADKFFKIFTYTGDGVNNRTISHSLGSEVGMIIIKRTDSSDNWNVYHRKAASYNQTNGYYTGRFDSNVQFGYRTIHTVTSTNFKVSSDSGVNANGGTYVVYMFAHNGGNGTFGETSDQDIISCGGFTADSTGYAEIDMGFEPQFVLYRPSDDTSDWKIIDSMRGFMGGVPFYPIYNRELVANRTAAEGANDGIHLTAKGFNQVSGYANKNFIYLAVRRPMAAPASATDCFAVDGSFSYSRPNFYSGWPVDFSIVYSNGTSSQYPRWSYRKGMAQYNFAFNSDPSGYSIDSGYPSYPYIAWDYMTGFGDFGNMSPNYNVEAHMWKRAKGFMDVQIFKGLGGNTPVPHNLEATPEFMLIKKRNGSGNWMCKHTGIGLKEITLNGTSVQSGSNYWQTGDSATHFYTTSGNDNKVNNTSSEYIAVLFSSLDGIAKVGNYTGNGSGNGQNQTIDCGFSSTPRFIVIKNADQYNRWYYWDSINGIVAGSELRNYWNSGSVDSALDLIDPTSSGFTVNWYNHSDHNMNTNGHKYIYYAVA